MNIRSVCKSLSAFFNISQIHLSILEKLKVFSELSNNEINYVIAFICAIFHLQILLRRILMLTITFDGYTHFYFTSTDMYRDKQKT